MNIVIYARYSYSGQREESIEGQLKICREYADKNNYNVIFEYIDRAKSARSDARPQFQQMIEDSKAKRFQAILVYQLDRFSRDRFDSAFYKHKLRKNGVAVISARENIDDSPEGKMMAGILESFAEYQSNDMAQKIIRGHRINAEKCIFNGGVVPLGYKIDSEKHYQIDHDMARIVSKVFSDYNDGIPIVDIVEDLRAAGIKTSRDTEFTVNSFRNLLQNKRYTGCYVYGDIEIPGGIPRIIDDDVFESVQQKLERNKRAPGSKIQYLLTTKLFCGLCNSIMVGRSGTSKTGKVYSYYSCNSHREHKCDMRDFPKDKLEDVVVDACRQRLTDDSISMICREVSLLTKEEFETPLVKAMRNEIKTCENAIENLMKALERGQEADLILDRLSTKREELSNLQKQYDKETAHRVVLEGTEIEFFLTKLRDGSINEFKYRKLLITTLINKVVLYPDHVTIYFNSSKDPIEVSTDISNEVERIQNTGNSSISKPLSNSQLCSHVSANGVPITKRSTNGTPFCYSYNRHLGFEPERE